MSDLPAPQSLVPEVSLTDLPTVQVTVRDGIGRVRLNAPERLNAVDADMLNALATAVQRLGERDDVRVIAVTGTGRGFCSGAHLGALSSADEVGTETLDGAARAIRALVGSPRPVVALVNGVAAGVGCSLALACHYVVAAESASFLLAFTRIGLMPDGAATALVAASIGRARALRMALRAEPVDATTAAAWGLIAQACPDDEFAAQSEALLAEFAAGPTRAYAATGAAINAATLPELDATLTREAQGQTGLLRTSDFREGISAFAERRRTYFTGR